MSRSYWETTVLKSRVSRRRALVVSGGSALGAVLLAACGGGDDDSSTTTTKGTGGGLVVAPQDASKGAKSGGNWVLHHPEDPPNIDPLSTQFFGANFQPHFTYSRPLKYKVGTINSPPKGEVEGDAFESWELAPDKMAITFKLRKDLKFDPQAPVNGRAATIDDVKFSWNKFSTSHVARSSFLNSLNPSAPILSMETPDASTITFKLAQPYVPIVSQFAVNRGLVIQPVEADGKFNPASDMHGTGPWMLTKYQPSVGLDYKRNPNYYQKEKPYIDTITRPIITEYAQQLAQFENGTLWQFDPRPEDIIPVRKRQQKMLMMGTGWNDAYPTMLQFDWKSNSVFKDERVRRAFSMLIDRDLWIETFNNTKAYRDEGIDIDTRWHSHFSAGDPRYWLDPKTDKLGEASKYFKYDVAGAKQLLAAAAKSGIEFPYQFQSPSATQQQQEVIAQMLVQGGVKPVLTPLNRTTWTTQCHTGGGKWDGLCADLAAGAGVDIDVWLDTRVRFGGSQYVPYTEPLAKIDDLCKAQKLEFDEKKRTEIILQIQREMASQMVAVPYPGIAERYQLAWPWLANFGYVQAVGGGYTAGESYVNYWYDESKKV